MTPEEKDAHLRQARELRKRADLHDQTTPFALLACMHYLAYLAEGKFLEDPRNDGRRP